MKRLFIIAVVVAAGCGKEPGPASPPPASAARPPLSKADPKEAAVKLLAQAEAERAPALYEQAVTAFTALIEADPADAAARESRALARWRLALARGVSDPEVGKDLEGAGNRPRAKALKALVRLVDGSRERGGWEPLSARILKTVFAKAFPGSASFETDWVALVRPPEGEIQGICEALAGAPDWPLAAGVRAALEGRDVPTPGKEGILWILTALRLPGSEAMKMLETATGPDQGILIQAQAQLLAAEERFTEATGRMTAFPMSLLRAAAHVAANKPAAALESLGTGETSAFARALKAAALIQTGTEGAMAELDKLLETTPIAWLKFERGIRRLASGDPKALEDFRAAAPAGGALSAAWLGFALWHLQDFDGAAKELARTAELKPSKELAAAIEETWGHALIAKGDLEAGGERLVAAAAKGPTREIFIKLAPHLRANRLWKALKELGGTVARSIPGDAEPWAAQAEASFWMKDYDAAVASVTFAESQKIDPKRLLKWRALAFEELKKFAEAHDDWSRLVELVPHEGEALAHRAWMKANLGRWAQVKDDAEQGVSKGANAWALALARFALAGEALHGPPPEGETVDPAGRKEAALEHLRVAVKAGAVEPSDLKTDGPFAPLAGSEEWKKLVESSAEKQKELRDEARRSGSLGVTLDHGGGSVAVTGAHHKSGACQAGIAPGDIILEVEGRRVHHVPDVSSALAGREPGQKVTVKIERELRPKLKLVQVRTITLTSRELFWD